MRRFERVTTSAATADKGLRGVRDIPGPDGGWLLGNALEFRRDLLGLLTRGMHEHGDVVRYAAGPRGTPLRVQLVVLHNPRDVQQVLTQTEKTFSKDTKVFQTMAEMLGKGLLTSVGDDWKRQRRIVQPLFTPRRVEGYLGLMAEESAALTARAPADGSSVDLHLLMMRYALRVVGRALFGDDIEDMVPVLDELVPEASSITRRRMFTAFKTPLSWRLPTTRRARFLKVRQYGLVDEILARSPAPGQPSYDADRDDLVTRLRQATDPETGEHISEDEVRDQALIFLMAGHETTAGALTFTLHLLGRHPEIQDAVAAEACDVLGSGDTVTPEQLARLVLTTAALQEGMRLFPSAHTTNRLTVAPIEAGGYRLPPGQPILVSPWTTHRHPEFWPDPLRYDPQRFLGESNRPRYAYFPFGGGPRACVGEHFAMLEAVTLLAMLLRSRRVTALRADLPVAPNVTLRPVGAVPASLETR
jgi:cytochrome P450